MSKKIIYLLSLLMALSLVFASCKKGGGSTDPTGGATPPDQVTPPDNVNSSTGLYDDWNKMEEESAAKGGALQVTSILQYKGVEGGGDYTRNPVVVTLGDQQNVVLVVAEYRYKTPGADNDIGVDGSTVVDIGYAVSANAGVSFAQNVSFKTIAPAGADAGKAHGAPVVFKVDKNKVVIVASAGAALSRVNESYDVRNQKSRLDYIVGTWNGSDMTWGTEWKTVDTSAGNDFIKLAIEKIQKTTPISGATFAQYATHSGRGVVVNNNELLLPVVIADQGNNTTRKEYMGYLLVKGTWTSSDVTWNDISAPTAGKDYKIWNNDNAGGTVHKEARLLTAASESDYNFLVVPRGDAGLLIGKGNGSAVTTTLTMGGYDGSAGFVQVPSWYGTAQYNPSTYLTQPNNKPKNLLSHVKSYEGDLQLYFLNDTFSGQDGNALAIKGHEGSGNAKSSSLDVLGDGTIVMVSEGGLVEQGVKRSFFVNFSRYTQKWLADQTGNNK